MNKPWTIILIDTFFASLGNDNDNANDDDTAAVEPFSTVIIRLNASTAAGLMYGLVPDGRGGCESSEYWYRLRHDNCVPIRTSSCSLQAGNKTRERWSKARIPHSRADNCTLCNSSWTQSGVWKKCLAVSAIPRWMVPLSDLHVPTMVHLREHGCHDCDCWHWVVLIGEVRRRTLVRASFLPWIKSPIKNMLT
eukprot:scaffold80460_cov66-Attheya_sp.AAC.1